MNRRSFLSFFALAPLATTAVGAATATMAVVGLDGGSTSGEIAIALAPIKINACDLQFIAARQFQLREIANFYRVLPDRLGRLA